MSNLDDKTRQWETLLLASMIMGGNDAIEEASQVASPEFFRFLDCKIAYEAILALHADGNAADAYTLCAKIEQSGVMKNAVPFITEITRSDVNTQNSRLYAMEVRRAYARREAMSVASELGKVGSTLSGEFDISALARRLEQIEQLYQGNVFRQLQNPVEYLRDTDMWSIRTGIEGFDKILRFHSKELIIGGGDPNVGKSTIGNIIAAHAALVEKRPVYYVMVENDPHELALALITMTRKMTSAQVGQMLGNPSRRTPDRIAEVDAIWKEAYEGVPIYTYVLRGGPDELQQILRTIPRGSVVIIDHIYAIVAQADKAGNHRADYQDHTRVATMLDVFARGNNCVVLAWTQFTKAGRQGGEERDPDAFFGGAGIRNIAKVTFVVAAEPYHNPAFSMANVTFHKCKIRSVVDDEGKVIDPAGRSVSLTIDLAYRTITS